MNRDLRDFLSFSRGERAGLLLLLAIILLLIFYNTTYFLWVKPRPTDFSTFEKDVAVFLAARKEKQEKQMNSFPDRYPRSINSATRLFFFNPNNLPEESWKELGLQEWQIKVIKNFEAKGGRFSTKSDVQKIYGISAADYARLEPWISLPDKGSHREAAFPYTKNRGEVLELNSADSVDLLQLPGVGPYMASNIVKYRNKLGGFTHTEQLMEVYRMQVETYAKLHDYIRVDTTLVVPGLKINTADFFLLLKHPYISKPLAYSITAHRQRYGKFRSIEDFRKVQGVNDSIWLILRPYLSCEE